MLNRIGNRDRAVYFRSLTTTIEAGIGITHSLEMLAEQTENPRLAEISQELARYIETGHTLSAAMHRHPEAFSELHQSMVKLGERTGALALVLDRIARHEEKFYHLNRQMVSSLAMPTLITLSALTMALFLPPLLFDSLFSLVNDLGVEVPPVTRLLMAFSTALRSPVFWLTALGLIAGAVWGLKRALEREENRRLADAFLLQLPAFGRLFRLSATTRFTRALATLVTVGAPILGALPLAARVSGSELLKAHIKRSVRALADGENLAAALAETHYFPEPFLATVEVGQDSGKLSELLDFLADLYESDLEHAYEVLAATVEPVVLVVVGCLVGFMVVATMFPMMKVLEAL